MKDFISPTQPCVPPGSLNRVPTLSSSLSVFLVDIVDKLQCSEDSSARVYGTPADGRRLFKNVGDQIVGLSSDVVAKEAMPPGGRQLCDSIWHVSFRSVVANYRTAISVLLILTCLLTDSNPWIHPCQFVACPECSCPTGVRLESLRLCNADPDPAVHAIHYGRSPAYLTETVQSVGASRSRCGLRSSSTSSMDYSII